MCRWISQFDPERLYEPQNYYANEGPLGDHTLGWNFSHILFSLIISITTTQTWGALVFLNQSTREHRIQMFCQNGKFSTKKKVLFCTVQTEHVKMFPFCYWEHFKQVIEKLQAHNDYVQKKTVKIGTKILFKKR